LNPEPGTRNPERRAVFLDRDGTINKDAGYIGRAEQVVFFPWTVEAIRALNQAGLPVIVVTNQAGIARGLYTEADLARVHRHVSACMEAGGARIDAYYYCPHHPEGIVEGYGRGCDCRKPGPGMIQQAVRDHGFDPTRSFVVGDKWLDIGLGHAVGAQSILVRTGYGAEQERTPRAGVVADAVVDNLAAAVSWILQRL